MKEIDYFVKILSQWRKKEGKRIQGLAISEDEK